MAGNKFLQGQLNQPITRPTYKGGKSDSLELIVNNSDMTITGNVIWDAFIGTTLKTAYSGADGERNYKAILRLTDELNDSIEQFVNYKSRTDSRLVAVENVAKTVDENITSKLDTEINRSVTKDDELLEKLIVESQRALAAEAEFVHLLETEALLRSDVDSEVKAEIELLSNSVFDRIHAITETIDSIRGDVKSLETSLIEQITAENLRSVTAEKELTNKLEETNRALALLKSEVSTLSVNNSAHINSSLLELADQIATETERARAQETELCNNLDIVNSRVTDVAISLSSQLSEIVTDYKLADSRIIDRMEATASKHNDDIKHLSSKIKDTNAEVATLDNKVDRETSRIDNLVAESFNVLTDRINVASASIDAAELKNKESIDTIREEYLASDELLAGSIKREAALRGRDISRLDADISTLRAVTTNSSEDIDQLETAVTQLTNKSETTSAEFNKSIDNIVVQIRNLDNELQAELTEETARAIASEKELTNSILDTTRELEAVEGDLNVKLIAVTAQLDELKETTTASAMNTIVSLDSVQSSISELQAQSDNQFLLLTATDAEIEKQLRLLHTNVDDINEEVVDIKSNMAVNTKNISDLSDQIKKHDEILSDLDNSVSDVETSVSRVTDTIQQETMRAVAAENVIANNLESVKSSIDSITSELQNVNTTVNDQKSTLLQQSTDVEKISADVAEVVESIDQITADVIKLSSTLAENDEKLLLLDAKDNEVVQQLNSIEQKQLNVDDQISSLQSTVINMGADVKSVSDRIDTTADYFEKLDERDNAAESSIQELSDTLKDETERAIRSEKTISIKLDAALQDISKLSNIDVIQTTQIKDLTGDVSVLQSEVESQKTAIMSLNSDVSNIISNSEEAQENIELNRSNIEELTTTVSCLSTVVDKNNKLLNDKDNSQDIQLAEHKSEIDKHSGQLTLHDVSIAELVANDAQTRTTLNNLYKQLNEEIVERQDQQEITNIEQAKESKRSKSVDEQHDLRINNLETNLSSTESRLASAIKVKETESLARDNYLQEKINLNFDILDEVLQTTADELSTNILDERGDRAEADKVLQTQINNISAVVDKDDAVLSTLVHTVTNEFDTIDEYIIQNDSKVMDLEQNIDVLVAESRTHLKMIPTEHHQVYTQDGTSTLMLPLTQGAEAGAIVKRTEAGNIQLPADVTKIGAADAVPKSYVESLINDVKDVLYEEIKNFSFDIIDGGKAPIKK